ncbi:YslB family protein [Carnobacterium mobile]|uniref:YslB family protein n=1 Tax=Carnobacterium mobile TaxID=2750 RepID=UPI0009FCB33C|nr:YslB family protein [Carnobacterium mobile]
MNDQRNSVDLNIVEGNDSLFSYTLIRDALIPNLLGQETNEILYWAGKELARQYPLNNQQDTILFFKKAGFGTLTVDSHHKNKVIFRLSGFVVENRLAMVKEPSFNLEAGFLAEQIQQQESLYTEAIYEIKSKAKSVLITLQQDTKDLSPIAKPDTYFVFNQTDKEKLSADEHEETALEKLDEVFADPVAQAIDETVEEVLDEQALEEQHPLKEEAPSVFDEWPSRSAKHKKK